MASGRVGVTRLRFLREGLAELDATLRGRLGLPLLVPQGPPVETLRRCWRRFGAAALTWEACGEEYAVARDGAVREAAAQDGVRVAAVPGHTLHDPEALLALCPRREPPTKYNDFLRLLEAAGPPPALGPKSSRCRRGCWRRRVRCCLRAARLPPWRCLHRSLRWGARRR